MGTTIPHVAGSVMIRSTPAWCSIEGGGEGPSGLIGRQRNVLISICRYWSGRQQTVNVLSPSSDF